jgi:hypothetical protein
MIDVAQIKSDLDNIISEYGISDESVNAAKFLYGCAFFGQDVEALSSNLNIPAEEATRFAENARANGIWREDGKVYADWSDEPISFMLDVMVITGMLARTQVADDGVAYDSELVTALPWIDDD